jgi:hypothetical protein
MNPDVKIGWTDQIDWKRLTSDTPGKSFQVSDFLGIRYFISDRHFIHDPMPEKDECFHFHSLSSHHGHLGIAQNR